MKIRLVQLDGSLPNLALMKLSSWHRAQGDYTYLTNHIAPDPSEPAYDLIYGSSIFQYSEKARKLFSKHWPTGVIGGTGTLTTSTVEDIINGEWSDYDYSGYPLFRESIGFTQRGCRMSCKFCVVPQKEGKPKSAATIAQLWRGDPHPRKLHILDNDFFGNPQWMERVKEIIDGKFRVCMSQGINVRLINDAAAEALAAIQYRDTKFTCRRLYTAWDNLRDEAIFFRGIERLEKHGVPSKHLMAYMLIGFDIEETWDRIWHRFGRMVEMGIKPYPMVYDRSRADLKCFQRWVLMGLYRAVPWPDYIRGTKTEASVESWKRVFKAVT